MFKFNIKKNKIISVIGVDTSSAESQHKIGEKDDHSKKVSFIHGLRPIYYFSRVLGLMPFSIIYDSNEKIKGPNISKLDGLWFVIQISLHLSMIYLINFNIRVAKQRNKTSSSTITTSDSLLLLSELFFGMVIMCINMCNRFKIIDVLNKFTIFDSKASNEYRSSICLLIFLCAKIIHLNLDGRQRN